MTIEIPQAAREQLLSSLQRYFTENMEAPIGTLAGNALIGFFVEELGPLIYNQAVADVQTRLQARVMELDLEVYEEPFQYWKKSRRGR